MNILIIGSNYTWSIECIYIRELRTLGHDVELFEAQNLFYDFYYNSFFNKLLYRLGLSNIIMKINDKLLHKVDCQNYDVIWIFKGMEVLPGTITKLKSKASKLINFNPDNPFIFSGKGSGNRNVTKSISLFDLHLTYDAWVKEKIEKKYKIKTEMLTFGFNDQAIETEVLNSIDEVKAACFLGNPDTFRASFIHSLLENGIEVHLYGNNWHKFINNKLAVIHKPVYGHDFYKTLRMYRVQLNIMRVHNLNSHNMRSMEITGVGGVLLAPKTADHLAFFEVEREIFIYDDNKSLVHEVKRILNLEKMVIDRLREKARIKVMEQFTYKILTKRIITLLNEA